MNRLTPESGLTLIELALTLAIVAISLNIVLPATENLVQTNRTQVAKQDVAKLMAFARSAAIDHRELVTLCSLGANETCQLPWGKSLSVFIDANGNGVKDNNDTLLRSQQFRSADWTHKYRPSNRGFFQWNSLGVSNGTAGSVEFCHPTHDASRFAVIVSFSGRIRVSRDLNGDGVPERNPGTPVGC
jgi:type IV fimbrial biogenesis protein FimT